MILAASEVVYQSLIAATVTVTLALIQVWAAKKTTEQAKEAADKADKAAGKVEEVKEVLATTTEVAGEKLDEIVETGEKIHTLVNSNMGVQLKISAVALRRVADYSKNAEDLAAAKMAEQALDQHEHKQAIVDVREDSEGV